MYSDDVFEARDDVIAGRNDVTEDRLRALLTEELPRRRRTTNGIAAAGSGAWRSLGSGQWPLAGQEPTASGQRPGANSQRSTTAARLGASQRSPATLVWCQANVPRTLWRLTVTQKLEASE